MNTVLLLHIGIFCWIISAVALVLVVQREIKKKRRRREEMMDRTFTDMEWVDIMRQANSQEARYYERLIRNGWSPVIIRTRRKTHNWKLEGF